MGERSNWDNENQGTGRGRTERLREPRLWTPQGDGVWSREPLSRPEEATGKSGGGWLPGSNVIQVLLTNGIYFNDFRLQDAISRFDIIETLPEFPDSNHIFSKTGVFAEHAQCTSRDSWLKVEDGH